MHRIILIILKTGCYKFVWANLFLQNCHIRMWKAYNNLKIDYFFFELEFFFSFLTNELELLMLKQVVFFSDQVFVAS
jgi:hypothetical protein